MKIQKNKVCKIITLLLQPETRDWVHTKYNKVKLNLNECLILTDTVYGVVGTRMKLENFSNLEGKGNLYK
jgi:hypothetical protein